MSNMQKLRLDRKRGKRIGMVIMSETEDVFIPFLIKEFAEYPEIVASIENKTFKLVDDNGEFYIKYEKGEK